MLANYLFQPASAKFNIFIKMKQNTLLFIKNNAKRKGVTNKRDT